MGRPMARTRTINRTAMLEAAQRVVARDGATRLTLDAVAAEAGISKASVLYDYKTKQALIKAVIEHLSAAEVARLHAFIEKEGDKPNAAILGLIAAAESDETAFHRNVALDLAVALNQHNDLRCAIQESIGSFIEAIQASSTYPRRGTVAFLAVEGLKLIESFGLYEWPPGERARILEDIRALLRPETPNEMQDLAL